MFLTFGSNYKALPTFLLMSASVSLVGIGTNANVTDAIAIAID